MEIQLTQRCAACQGTGIRTYNASPNGPLVTEDPCSECGGDGIAPAMYTIDPTVFESIVADLDYIHGKVTAIWNQVKPGN
uniref:Putative chaperone n=1 Tax=viral metagenome TaxID=1070528 RepID=A0A6M3JZU4_9ZZZZ